MKSVRLSDKINYPATVFDCFVKQDQFVEKGVELFRLRTHLGQELSIKASHTGLVAKIDVATNDLIEKSMVVAKIDESARVDESIVRKSEEYRSYQREIFGSKKRKDKPTPKQTQEHSRMKSVRLSDKINYPATVFDCFVKQDQFVEKGVELFRLRTHLGQELSIKASHTGLVAKIDVATNDLIEKSMVVAKIDESARVDESIVRKSEEYRSYQREIFGSKKRKDKPTPKQTQEHSRKPNVTASKAQRPARTTLRRKAEERALNEEVGRAASFQSKNGVAAASTIKISRAAAKYTLIAVAFLGIAWAGLGGSLINPPKPQPAISNIADLPTLSSDGNTDIKTIQSSALAELATSEGFCADGNCVNGYGRFKFANGDQFEGYFKDGQRGFWGTYFSKTSYNRNSSEVYTGGFDGPKRKYWGIASSKWGGFAIGKFKDTKFGKTMLFNVKNNLVSRYRSSYYLGKPKCIGGDCMDGFGSSINADGSLYTGFFKDGQPFMWGAGYTKHGYLIGFQHPITTKKNGLIGVTTSTDRKISTSLDGFSSRKRFGVGCLIGNCTNGMGIEAYSNSTLYAGNFTDGRPHHHGHILQADGTWYFGRFNKGQQDNCGLSKWPKRKLAALWDCDLDGYNGIRSTGYNGFEDIARGSGGSVKFLSGRNQYENALRDILINEGRALADVSLVIDHTGSMSDDIEEVNAIAQDIFSNLPYGSWVGVSSYGDNNYSRDWLWYNPLSENIDESISDLLQIKIGRGSNEDQPESVYDAVYQVLVRNDWESYSKRCIIVMGDATPHEGKLTQFNRNDILTLAKQLEVEIHFLFIGQ